MFEVSIERAFSAAHHLRGYVGDCSRLHGHNWVVKVMVQTEQLDKIGISMDFRKLKTELDKVLEELDHCNLNELKIFEGTNPTSEEISRFIYRKLSSKINTDAVKVSRVTIFESETTSASYFE
jgi:6-pyruvoyltetrahydropterin/6-carboxytetrahydropterin synthase